MNTTHAQQPQDLNSLLTGARLWGIELDPKFRVLAATVELTAEAQTQLDGSNANETSDQRHQVLTFPVSTILASLRERPTPDGDVRILTFAAEQLLDVSSIFGGQPLGLPIVGRPEPRPGQWAPQFSLEGRSTAPDGRTRTMTYSVRTDDAELDLFIRCDEVELRTHNGELVHHY